MVNYPKELNFSQYFLKKFVNLNSFLEFKLLIKKFV